LSGVQVLDIPGNMEVFPEVDVQTSQPLFHGVPQTRGRS
jgi:hypothetical protein